MCFLKVFHFNFKQYFRMMIDESILYVQYSAPDPGFFREEHQPQSGAPNLANQLIFMKTACMKIRKCDKLDLNSLFSSHSDMFCYHIQILVVPGFQFLKGPVKHFPANKQELLQLWKKRTILPFQ